jgi:hypothetical protein
LQRLDLSGTSVTDLSPLAGLTSLEDLMVSKETPTEPQLDALRRVLPRCAITRH